MLLLLLGVGWEPGDTVYWTKTVWLRARVRTMAARLLSLYSTYQCAWVGLQRVSQIPRWVSKLTVSIGWDLFSMYGKVWPGFTYTCGSFQSAYSTGDEIRAQSSGEAIMGFCKGMKQPLADLQPLQPEKKETASEPSLWHTPEDLKHVRGRCTTWTDDKHTKYVVIFFSLWRFQRTEGP